jgi:hypothetical protein
VFVVGRGLAELAAMPCSGRAPSAGGAGSYRTWFSTLYFRKKSACR